MYHLSAPLRQIDTTMLDTAALKGRDISWNKQICLCETMQWTFGQGSNSLQGTCLPDPCSCKDLKKKKKKKIQGYSLFLTSALCGLDQFHSNWG